MDEPNSPIDYHENEISFQLREGPVIVPQAPVRKKRKMMRFPPKYKNPKHCIFHQYFGPNAKRCSTTEEIASPCGYFKDNSSFDIHPGEHQIIQKNKLNSNIYRIIKDFAGFILGSVLVFLLSFIFT